MKYVVCTARAQAQQFADAIDAELGYPRAGVRAAGGGHPPTLFVTVRHGDVRKHPARNEWAFPDDGPVLARRASVPLPSGAASKNLEPDWDE